MRKVIPVLTAITLVFAAISCGGDDDDTPTESGTPTSPGVATELEAQLASVLLTDADVPDYLQGSGLTYSKNEDLAGPNKEELDRLNAIGRQLGVDLTFIPTETAPEGSPVSGGIQNSASVYSDPQGASATFMETATQARMTDWAASYPELSDLHITEVDRTVGDESLWIRITGSETCAVQTPAGASPDGPAETFVCPESRIVVDDYVIFRAGRTRSLVKVLSSHPDGSGAVVFQDQVQEWAQLIVERAGATFATPVS